MSHAFVFFFPPFFCLSFCKLHNCNQFPKICYNIWFCGEHNQLIFVILILWGAWSINFCNIYIYIYVGIHVLRNIYNHSSKYLIFNIFFFFLKNEDLIFFFLTINVGLLDRNSEWEGSESNGLVCNKCI